VSISILELKSLVDGVKKRERQPDYMATFLLDHLGISRPAVPVQLLAENLGIRVIETDLEADVSGALITQSSGTLIAVNARHGKNRQRFTLAHEIGHFVLEHSGMKSHVDRHFTVIRRDNNSSTATDQLEIQANRFAASLLMPTNFIVKEFAKYGSFDNDTIDKLAQRYVVSSLAFQIRLSNLGFYTPVE
jgi:Zn-dependent peptidase ImmA (M78 family)